MRISKDKPEEKVIVPPPQPKVVPEPVKVPTPVVVPLEPERKKAA